METQWQDDVRDKHHWTTSYKWSAEEDDVWENCHCLASNKWWSIDDKMMFVRIIIIKNQIIDDKTMIKLC